MDIGDMAAAYNAAAAIYPRRFAQGSVSRLMLERLAPMLPREARVADVGCGAGRATRWLDGRGFRVVSIDLSPEMLRLTREGRPDAWAARADMRALPIATRSMDALTAFFSVLHLPKADVPRALAEFRRVVRPGGKLVMAVRRGEGDAVGPTDWADGRKMHFSDFLEDEAEELLKGAGFRIVTSETCEPTMKGRSETHLFYLAGAVP